MAFSAQVSAQRSANKSGSPAKNNMVKRRYEEDDPRSDFYSEPYGSEVDHKQPMTPNLGKNKQENEEDDFQEENPLKLQQEQIVLKRRENYEKQMLDNKRQVEKDMRDTQANMSVNQGRGSVQINNKEYNLEDINIKKLTQDQNKDINDIAKL